MQAERGVEREAEERRGRRGFVCWGGGEGDKAKVAIVKMEAD